MWRLQFFTVIAKILCQWANALTWLKSKESIGIANGTANFANFVANFAR